MQAVPESRQQTFDEIYGPPENFLEIEVRFAAIETQEHHAIPPKAYYIHSPPTQSQFSHLN